MSILSQIGIVFLIGFIIYVLIRSNRALDEVASEGEHFVDEWDLRQRKKEERRLARSERMAGWNQEERKEMERTRESETMDIPEEGKWTEENWEEESREDENWAKEERKETMVGEGPSLVLVELDEHHRPLRRVTVDHYPFSIGRGKENDLVLDDLCVARQHCRIVMKNQVYMIEDSGSRNKIYVDGLVTERTILSNQMHVFIGDVEFRIEMKQRRSQPTRLRQNMREYSYE